MNRYFITGYMGEGAKRMLYDLEALNNVQLIPEEISNRYLRFLFYRTFEKIGFRSPTRIKKLFYYIYALNSIKYDIKENNYVIFMNSKFWTGYDIEFLRQYKKKHPYIKLVLYIVDPMKNSFEYVCSQELLDMFHIVLSINSEDCMKYGYQYYPLVYSRINVRKQTLKQKADLYYLGSGTDRTELLHNIWQQCKKAGINVDFKVRHGVKNDRRYSDEIIYLENSLPYDENLQLILNTKCMLEIMHEGFDNPTQRYVEAVAYNKKLLTNNPNIVNFEYYNSEYMKIFQSVQDIDFDWLIEESDVDYHYNGNFSPIKLLEFIHNKRE